MSDTGVPASGIVASTTLASIAMIINYLGSGGATVFTTLVLTTVITAAIPYGFSALAQIKWRLADHREHTPRCTRDVVVAVLSSSSRSCSSCTRATPGKASRSTLRLSS
jgi:basic amino acid/polyamine antiporter, APA family